MPEQVRTLREHLGKGERRGMSEPIRALKERVGKREWFRESVLLFDPVQGEEMFLCCSPGCERGPGINRDGKGPPWMERVDRPWEGTTDADEQRLGTWFIDMESKQKRLKQVNINLSNARTKLQRAQAKLQRAKSRGVATRVERLQEEVEECQGQVEKWDRILNGIPGTIPRLADYSVHEEVFRQEHAGYEIIGEQGCGDLTMNLWNVGYVNSPLAGEPKLIYLNGEPITQRRYTCLVKWTDTPESSYYSIETLRFNPFVFAVEPRSPNVVLALRGEAEGRMVETGVADRVEFAVYGQQVIRGGELVPLGQNVLEFGDLRHVFLMPNLNPEKKLNYPGDSGRPRFIYGREQYDPVWFGEAQLLNDRNLRRAALDGPIELSRLYLGMGVSMAHVRAVKEGDYAVATSEYAASDRYHEETTHVRPLEPGEWRFVPEDSSLVEIYLKPNTFAFTMIGLDGLGRILCLACNGNPGQLGLLPYGRTLETAARRLLNLGAQDAILVDEGGDVFQKIERPGKAGGLLEALPLRRQQVRAMLIFARKKRGAGAASPPGEKGARR